MIYKEFEWHVPEAGNGESGVQLTNMFVAMVKSLADVKTVCDLGCGNGYMAGRLAEAGYHVIGVDASESGIAVARRHFLKPTFIQNAIDAGLRDRAKLGEFDLVISSDVIEHMYRPADLIEAAASLMRSNGHLLVGTPYHGYLKNLLLSVSGKMDKHFSALDVGGHIKFFSVDSLSRLLTSQGLTDIKFNYFGRAPWLWKNMIAQTRRGTR